MIYLVPLVSLTRESRVSATGDSVEKIKKKGLSKKNGSATYFVPWVSLTREMGFRPRMTHMNKKEEPIQKKKRSIQLHHSEQNSWAWYGIH